MTKWASHKFRETLLFYTARKYRVRGNIEAITYKIYQVIFTVTLELYLINQSLEYEGFESLVAMAIY